MMATTRGGVALPCHAAAWRTSCTSALASVPVAHAKGSVLCSLNLGGCPLLLLLLFPVPALLLLLLPLLVLRIGFAGVQYQTLKLLGLSSAAPTTCAPDIWWVVCGVVWVQGSKVGRIVHNVPC